MLRRFYNYTNVTQRSKKYKMLKVSTESKVHVIYYLFLK